MQLLKEYIKKTLAHRHMGHQMIGAIALNTVRTFLNSQKSIKSKVESRSNVQTATKTDFTDFGLYEPSTSIEGYVRFKVLFLKTSNQALKIQIFKQKNQIIREVNLALERVGYKTRVNELRIKN